MALTLSLDVCRFTLSPALPSSALPTSTNFWIWVMWVIYHNITDFILDHLLFNINLSSCHKVLFNLCKKYYTNKLWLFDLLIVMISNVIRYLQDSSYSNISTIFLIQQLMERLKKIVKLPHRLRPVQSSKVSPGSVSANAFLCCWTCSYGCFTLECSPRSYEKTIYFS